MITTLCWLVLGMFITSAIVYLANKKIAANLYERTYGKEHKIENKSPYSIAQQRDVSSGEWGWSIMKNGEVLKDSKGFFPIYRSSSVLIGEMNKIEKTEGYDITKI